MIENEFPYICQLTKLQSEVVDTIFQQVEAIITLQRKKILDQDPDHKFQWDDLEVCAANFMYRIIDGDLQIKAPRWLYWESIRGLHCNNIYSLAQDADVFLPHVIRRLKEEVGE